MMMNTLAAKSTTTEEMLSKMEFVINVGELRNAQTIRRKMKMVNYIDRQAAIAAIDKYTKHCPAKMDKGEEDET